MTETVEKLKEWVEESHKIVFFGGAGVSTESGIPDFRSTGGLYQQEWKYPPETILSHTFYLVLLSFLQAVLPQLVVSMLANYSAMAQLLKNKTASLQ